MRDLKDVIKVNEANIFPRVYDDEMTLYDLIKDSVEIITYDRPCMGYTNYLNMKELRAFLRENKIPKEEWLHAISGKKSYAPAILINLFTVLTKCAVIHDPDNINLEDLKDQMREVIDKINVGTIDVGGGWDLRYYGRAGGFGGKRFGGPYNYLDLTFGGDNCEPQYQPSCKIKFSDKVELNDVFRK